MSWLRSSIHPSRFFTSHIDNRQFHPPRAESLDRASRSVFELAELSPKGTEINFQKLRRYLEKQGNCASTVNHYLAFIPLSVHSIVLYVTLPISFQVDILHNIAHSFGDFSCDFLRTPENSQILVSYEEFSPAMYVLRNRDSL